MSSQGASVVVEPRDGVAHVTFANPPRNVLTLALIDELRAGFVELRDQPVHATILRGAGDDFSAGVDVAAHAPGQAATMLQRFHGLVREIWRGPQVRIAVLDGLVLGGAFELALACDLVVVTSRARLAFAEIDVGCFAPLAAVLLPERIGHQRASELMYLGRSLAGTDAERLGLANACVESADLNDHVERWSRSLTSRSRAALRAARSAVVGLRMQRWQQHLEESEQIYLASVVPTHDAAEGVNAFADKRAPVWKHR